MEFHRAGQLQPFEEIGDAAARRGLGRLGGARFQKLVQPLQEREPLQQVEQVAQGVALVQLHPQSQAGQGIGGGGFPDGDDVAIQGEQDRAHAGPSLFPITQRLFSPL